MKATNYCTLVRSLVTVREPVASARSVQFVVWVSILNSLDTLNVVAFTFEIPRTYFATLRVRSDPLWPESVRKRWFQAGVDAWRVDSRDETTKRGKQKAWQSRQTFVRNTRRLRLGPTAVRQPNQPGYAQPRLLLIQTRHFIRACAVCLPCATSSTGRGSCTMAVADRAIRPRGPFLLLPLHSAGPLFPTTRAEQQASPGVTSALL